MVRRTAIVLALAALAACGSKAEEGKRLAAALTRDPASAQFQEVREKDGVVCGEMNAKNGFGAYTGFKKFIVRNGQIDIEPDVPSQNLAPGIDMAGLEAWENRTAFSSKWLSHCRATQSEASRTRDENQERVGPQVRIPGLESKP